LSQFPCKEPKPAKQLVLPMLKASTLKARREKQSQARLLRKALGKLPILSELGPGNSRILKNILHIGRAGQSEGRLPNLRKGSELVLSGIRALQASLERGAGTLHRDDLREEKGQQPPHSVKHQKQVKAECQTLSNESRRNYRVQEILLDQMMESVQTQIVEQQKPVMKSHAAIESSKSKNQNQNKSKQSSLMQYATHDMSVDRTPTLSTQPEKDTNARILGNIEEELNAALAITYHPAVILADTEEFMREGQTKLTGFEKTAQSVTLDIEELHKQFTGGVNKEMSELSVLSKKACLRGHRYILVARYSELVHRIQERCCQYTIRSHQRRPSRRPLLDARSASSAT
jgi:hypothetical protein